jgi:tryptophan synthase alpha chain
VIGASADGVVVGTAIVNAVANVLGPKVETTDPAEAVATQVNGLRTAFVRDMSGRRAT